MYHHQILFDVTLNLNLLIIQIYKCHNTWIVTLQLQSLVVNV
jgi:hypothetical protein